MTNKSKQENKIWRLDKDHVLHPWEHFKSFEEEGALVIEQGKDAYIYDDQGMRYFDAVGGLWCTNIGLGRREMAEAIAAQIEKLTYANPFVDMTNTPAALLAKRLTSLAPANLNHVIYSNGGSTAIESAARLAHFYQACRGKTNKKHFIAQDEGYHGSTYMAMSLTGKSGDRIPLFQYENEYVHHVSCPNIYRSPEAKGEAEFCDYLIEEFEKKILDIGAENIAAFFAEPILGSGGVIIPPEDYNYRTWQLCKKYDVLYIADEVVTAFGRVGCWFASETLFNVQPDMVTCAKGLTSGYLPLGATLYSDEIHASISKGDANRYFAHGFTYSGHPVCCTAALKSIEIIEREGLIENVKRVGVYFQSRLSEFLELSIVGDVRGKLFMMCVEFVANKSSRELLPDEYNIGKRIAMACEKNGLIVRPIAHLNVMSPALTMTTEQVDFIVDTLSKSIKSVMTDLADEGVKLE